MEAAAGIAGLIKVVLQLNHKEIAPHLNFKTPNPYIDWHEIPLKVITQPTPWSPEAEQRVGGVSSFAISGTNAHVVLAEGPTPVERESMGDRLFHLLTLSAKTQPALEALANRYHQYLVGYLDLDIADVCYTANTGRADFDYRLVAIATDQQNLADKMLGFSTGEVVPGLFSGHANDGIRTPKVTFLFTGQGSQSVDMGQQLYQTQPLFQKALQQCSDILQPYLDVPLLDVLYPDLGKRQQEKGNSDVSALLDQTAYTQPALFALEYALARLWQSWGIQTRCAPRSQYWGICSSDNRWSL